MENYDIIIPKRRGCYEQNNCSISEYVVDAKSLLGLMNLGFHREIELEVHEEECEDLRKDIEEFIAA